MEMLLWNIFAFYILIAKEIQRRYYFPLTEGEGLAINIKKYQSTVAASTNHYKVALADFYSQKHHRSDRLRSNMLAP